MFGNCAVGSASMATIPTSTIRIEMTIATMGRRMKKFDMSLLPLCRFCGSQFRVYHCTLFRFLNALDNHALTRLKTLVDEDRKSKRLNSRHLGNSYSVFCFKQKKKASIRTPKLDKRDSERS